MFPRQIRGFQKITRLEEKITGYRRPALVELFNPVKCVELDGLETWLMELKEQDHRVMQADIYNFLDQIKTWKLVKR